MFLKRVIYAGVCVCLALPAAAVIASEYKETSLSMSTSTVQKVDQSLQAFIQQVWAESPAMQGA